MKRISIRGAFQIVRITLIAFATVYLQYRYFCARKRARESLFFAPRYWP